MPTLPSPTSLPRRAASDGTIRFSVLHQLLDRLHETIEYDDKSPTTSATTAAEALALKRGVCQDFTHIFIAGAQPRDPGALSSAGISSPR